MEEAPDSIVEAVENRIGGHDHGALQESIRASPVGIDTICFFVPLEPTMVRCDHTMQVMKSRKPWKNGDLFIDDAGVQVNGGRAVWNSTYINVTITPQPKRGPYASYRTGHPIGMCTIECSVAKILGRGDNRAIADVSGARRAVEHVLDELQSIGLNVGMADLENATLKRVDLFRDLSISPSSSVHGFLEVVKTIEPAFCSKMRFPTGSLDRNQSQSLSIYDKNAERRERLGEGALVNAEHLPGLLRAEQQFKKTKKIQTALGIKTIGDLLARFHCLPVGYVNAVRTALFRFDLKDLKSSRSFAGGSVHKRLSTIWKRVQDWQCAKGWTLEGLRLQLDAYGVGGLGQMLKRHIAKDAKDIYSWLNTRLREVKRAILEELLANPEAAARYRALRDCLVGFAPASKRARRAAMAYSTKVVRSMVLV